MSNRFRKSKVRINNDRLDMRAGSKKEDTVKTSFNIPRSIHSQFRQKTFLEEIDMTDIIIDAIVDYLRR